MRVFILTDLEGTAGVSRWGQVGVGDGTASEDYKQSKRWLTREVNAAVEGILAEKSDVEIVVWDGHGSGGVELCELHPGAKFIPRGGLRCPYGLGDAYDAVVMIAQHAKAGTADANLCHTYSLSVYRYWLNGEEIGEIGLRARVAGYYGVPVILVTGDEAACAESSKLIPGIVTIAVKKAIHQELCITMQPEKACRLIKEAAKKAVSKLGEIKPLTTPGPCVFRAQFLSTRQVQDVCYARKEVQKVDPYTVEIKGDNLIEAVQLFA